MGMENHVCGALLISETWVKASLLALLLQHSSQPALAMGTLPCGLEDTLGRGL